MSNILTVIEARSRILEFIEAVRVADAETAQQYLAPDATLTFPGPTTFDSLQTFFAWASQRYKNPIYHYDEFDLVQIDTIKTRVYAAGTIDGELLDGRHFAGVRFLDRFEFVDKMIVRKDAWSDMADRLRRMA